MYVKSAIEKLAKATKLLGETPEQRVKDTEKEKDLEQYPRVDQGS